MITVLWIEFIVVLFFRDFYDYFTKNLRFGSKAPHLSAQVFVPKIRYKRTCLVKPHLLRRGEARSANFCYSPKFYQP